MELIVKNSAEKRMAKRLQKNLAKYAELTEEEKHFLTKWVAACQVLLNRGVWVEATDRFYDYWRYRLNPDIKIVVEKEQTFAEREGIILCPIETQRYTTGWYINYPNGTVYNPETLGVLHCKGYEFLGWVHNDVCNDYNDIYTDSFIYRDSYGNTKYRSGIDYTPSTATHSVWRKVAE